MNKRDSICMKCRDTYNVKQGTALTSDFWQRSCRQFGWVSEGLCPYELELLITEDEGKETTGMDGVTVLYGMRRVGE